MSTISTGNYTIGGINLFFNASIAYASLLATDPSVDAGLGGAMRGSSNNLGNIVTAEVGNDTTYIDHFRSKQGKRFKDKVAANMTDITIPFTFDEINEANLRYFFTASDLTNNAKYLAVGQEPLIEGSAQLQFETDVGNDFTYFIPKCTIKPDGNLAMNEDDWWQGPMVLDVLFYDTGHWASKPYGFINASNLTSDD